MMRRMVMVMALAVAIGAAAHAEPTLRVTASGTTVSTVDVLNITIVAVTDTSQPPLFVVPLEDAFTEAGWTVRSLRADDPLLTGDTGEMRYTWHLAIEPFLDGIYSIPSLTLRTADGDVASEAITVDVRSVLADGDGSTPAASLGTLRGPITPRDPTPWLLLCVAGISSVLAAFGIVVAVSWGIRRWRASRPSGTVDTAHITVHDAARLLRKALANAGVSHAESMTADEIKADASAERSEDERIATDILRLLDAARFAAEDVPNDLIRRAVDSALRLRAGGHAA